MQINNLKLVNFRSYSHEYFDFNPRLNIIIGKNGIGKTNLVEAIYTLAIAKSFRTNNDCLLIKKDEKMALIKAEIQDKNVNEFKLSIENTGKSVLINDTKISRLSEYISQINVILFNPSDLKIIKDIDSEIVGEEEKENMEELQKLEELEKQDKESETSEDIF